ncbi:hypothetical protein [Filibacter tadaridae]|uniref:hypothetical protein n=1 Tax=Filibacter tadaridae TaxID=2483811 RepID=UPI000F520893
MTRFTSMANTITNITIGENAVHYYYNPEVKYLLINNSTKKVEMEYANFIQIKAPEIGPRPPFYTNPVYQPYIPIL